MKKRTSKFGFIGAGFALALAALGGTAQPATINKNLSHQEQKQATASKITTKQKTSKQVVGGLDLVQVGEYGMSPKEYGLRYGNGKSRKGKTNFKKLSHQNKVRRR
ncbi:hypothetical protein [Pedobacter sp.]|uniref:hypothetical protein n=1 Tax=Pedobacter sp. TaxID=1411316 RepID=UPI00396C337B